MTPAERQRRFRARRAKGRICVMIEVDAVNVVEGLIAKGLLRRQDGENPKAIGKALSRATIQIIDSV